MGRVAKVDAADRSDSLVETHEDDLIPRPIGGAVEQSETEVFRQWRGRLVDDAGQSFADFKATLRPRYGWIWLQTLLAYGGLGIIILALAASQPTPFSWWQTLFVGALAGVCIGYLIAFLALWLHESAHYNVHWDRAWNDRLANIFFGVIIMHHVRQYRHVHFGHHRHLGDVGDPEQSYFSSLNVRYIVESLTGLRVLRVLLARNRTGSSQKRNTNDDGDYLNWALPAGALLHLVVVLGSLYLQLYTLAFAWLFGVFGAYPFFGAIRQVLEHRRPDADPDVDYSLQPHGQYTRVFGTGLFASTFGGAGFNRHLIHHWDPGISCTVFGEVEQYLLRSQLRDFYSRRQTTYRETFSLLMAQSGNGRALDV